MGVEFEPIDIEWAFRIFKARHQEPAGQPISRIANKLNAPGTVIESELGVGARTPDGVWDRIGGKK